MKRLLLKRLIERLKKKCNLKRRRLGGMTVLDAAPDRLCGGPEAPDDPVSPSRSHDALAEMFADTQRRMLLQKCFAEMFAARQREDAKEVAREKHANERWAFDRQHATQKHEAVLHRNEFGASQRFQLVRNGTFQHIAVFDEVFNCHVVVWSRPYTVVDMKYDAYTCLPHDLKAHGDVTCWDNQTWVFEQRRPQWMEELGAYWHGFWILEEECRRIRAAWQWQY